MLYQPQIDDDYDDDDDAEGRATGGTTIGKGNRSTQRKLVPMALCPPQIPHDLTLALTLASCSKVFI
jgi:hypothetical protein